jgi:histone acetyltransferase 1
MEHDGQQFEIWKGCLADPAVKQLAKRIQIFVPLFIEGGTLIDLEDNDEILGRWTFFFLYAKQHNPTPGKSPYMFVGYSTVFRYYMYQRLTPPPEAPDRTQNAAPEYELPLSEVSFYDLPCRSRISQFLILPPFANKGAGSRFYNAIFEHFTQDPTTVEITVEDPNVDFDDMRDINDLIYLRTIPEFTALRINTNTKPRRDGSVPRDIIDLDSAEKIRAKHKIAPRQYNRLIEMQLLSLIPLGVRQSLIAERLKISGDELKAKKDEYRLWQLLAKQRLYKHNRDMLMQLERAERIDKLDETSSAVEADYARLLRAVEKRVSGKFHEGKGKAGKANGNGLLKRSSPDEAEESDEGEPTAKKVKFA